MRDGVLVPDIGVRFRTDSFSFEDAGFTLRYLGPGVGVLVDWHPRDELTAWVVRLVAGEFPARTAMTPHGQINYFDLGFSRSLAAFSGQGNSKKTPARSP